MIFEDTHKIIEAELAEVEVEVHRQLAYVCEGDSLLEALFQSWSGKPGKRLRPRLTLLSGYALRRSELNATPEAPSRSSLVALAAVVELVHSASLIHDDVLDRSDTRRGLPTLNARFGDKTAILAGDVLYSQVFEMLLDSVSPKNSRELIRCVRSMCRAEISNLTSIDQSSYERIIEGKTASLMQYCCRAGAEAVRTADDSPDLINALDVFGHSFGMVYQLVDDLCDDDVSDAAAPRDWLITRIHDYAVAAETALSEIPDSPYRQGLAAMLEYVLSEYKKVSVGHDPSAVVAAYTPSNKKEHRNENTYQTCLS